MEEGLQLVANFKDWKAVKKLKITNETPPFAVLEFFTAFMYSTGKKLEEYMAKIGNLEEINKELDSCSGFNEKLQMVRTRKMGSLFKDFISKANLPKKHQKPMKEFLQVYSVRRALKFAEINFNYAEVNVSSTKRLKKKDEPKKAK